MPLLHSHRGIRAAHPSLDTMAQIMVRPVLLVLLALQDLVVLPDLPVLVVLEAAEVKVVDLMQEERRVQLAC